MAEHFQAQQLKEDKKSIFKECPSRRKKKRYYTRKRVFRSKALIRHFRKWSLYSNPLK